MASYVIVRHKVKDFAAWKPVYDEHAKARREAGLTEKLLLRGANDPNEIVLVLEAQDLARARAFTEAPDLRETMARAGVIDPPDVYFLNDHR